MPVKIRLTRMGKKKQPSYRIVVMDSRKPRDGAYIEQIGRYDPREEPSIVEIDNDKALEWLERGAQPTDRAKKLLEISGAWTRFRVAKGDIHTIGTTAPPATPEPAAVETETAEAAATPEPVVTDEPAAAPEPAIAELATEVADAPAAESADMTAAEVVDVPAAESADMTAAEVVDAPAAEPADATAAASADVTVDESVEAADEPGAVPEAVEAATEDTGSEEEEQA